MSYGYHSTTSYGYLSSVKYPNTLGAKAVQIWLGNRQSYYFKPIPVKECKETREYTKKNDIFLISHSPYILNLARPLYESSKGQKALERYLNDLLYINKLGGVGSVLHMGSNVKELAQTLEKAYENFAKNLMWIIERKPEDSIIILENMAGGGSQIACTINEISKFWNRYITSDMRNHIKWCIDTAHLYAVGEYDISEPQEVMAFQEDFDELIGWENIICFHFNGSKSKIGSHHDCHADIGEVTCGEIRSDGMRTLARLAHITGKHLILEVPTDQTDLVHQLAIVDIWMNSI